jgi:hypothetical protein
MKKLTFYLMFSYSLFFCFTTKAQDFALGVRGGISVPNLSSGTGNNPLNSGYSSRFGPDAGVFGEFKISDLFSIQPMVEYSSQGGKKDGLQAYPTPSQAAGYFQEQNQPVPTYLYANFKSVAELDYLMIPVLAKFGWNFSKRSPWRFYVDAGPFADFLLSAHQVTSGESESYLDPAGKEALPGGSQSFDHNQDIKDQLNTTNFGIEGNIGFNYSFGTSSIFIEAGGNYGFLNIQKGTANGKNNTGAGTASIGYSYWFGK